MQIVNTFHKFKIIFFFVLLVVISAAGFWIFQSDKIKTSSFTQTGKVFGIETTATESSYDSTIYSADFEFNAIAPSWKEKNANELNRQFLIRTSRDNNTWTDWIDVDAIKPQKDNTKDDRLYPEVPIFEIGKYFQYKIKLTRATASEASPEVSDIKIDYIDSRPSLKQKVGQKISTMFKVYADSSPTIISRSSWGSPDPNGDLYKNDPVHYWPPVNLPVQQVFVHHTVDSNTGTDFSSVVRAIWQYHAVTLGWGDIGYNYLIDPNGSIYEGRFGGDGVVAGHTLNYNNNSIGVALIGCYQSNNSTCQQLNNNNVTAPSAAMIDSLTTLLAYKMTNYELDPNSTHNFCDYAGQNCLNLNMIAGHRDAYATACPGDLTYNNLATIRNTTATKKTSLSWSYSAKQIDYTTVNLNNENSTSTITLHFKNTGTSTWTNSGSGRILLKTANPANHASSFQSDTWIDSSTPAVLNEASVPPGSTGSFTIKFTRPTNVVEENYEYIKLVSENVFTFDNYFTLSVTAKTYIAQSVSQSNNINISTGGTAMGWVKVKNTGNQIWYDDTSVTSGNNVVHFSTAHPISRSSDFAYNWGAGSNRPNTNFTHVYESDGTTLAANQHIVSPNQIAYYEITFSAPQSLSSGTYTEYFQPIVENVYGMNDLNLSFTISVNAGATSTPIPTITPTPTSTPTPSPTPISFRQDGDLDGNRRVDLSDLSILALNWNKSTSSGDVNGDGKVDLSDLSILAINWNKNF